MRIIKFLLASAVALLIFGGIGLFLGREALLLWGVTQIKTDLARLQGISHNYGDYARQCRQKGSVLETNLIESYQLRFISPTDYVLEVVCAEFRLDPIVVASKSLPPYVRKLPGNAGILWGNAPSGIVVDAFGRRRTIVVEQEQMFFEGFDETASLGVGPVSSCAGYGFSCCQEETESGTGDQYVGVTDCPRSCYSECVKKPVILSFTSDPFMDPKTRTTTISSGEEVLFSYVIDSQGGEGHTVTVDFGDGEDQTLTELSSTATHQYRCTTGRCRYTARLLVTDNQGIQSAETALSKIQVAVN